MSEVYKFRAFLNTIDCSDARDSSISGYIEIDEGNDYSPPNVSGDLRIRDCCTNISLEFRYKKKRRQEEDSDDEGRIDYEDSIHKFDVLIAHIEQMKKAYIEAKEEVDTLMVGWEAKQKELKKKRDEEK